MKRTKILSVLFACLLFAVLSIGVSAVQIEISSAAELADFRDAVNSGENTDADVVLTADITLQDEWIGIGTTEYPFTGSFNGNGYKIYGFNVTKGAYAVGLFGVVGACDISNFEMVSPKIDITVSNTDSFGNLLYSGFVIGCMYYDSAETSTISQISIVDGTIDVESSTPIFLYVGGIAGNIEITAYNSAACVLVSDCTVLADVKCESNQCIQAGLVLGKINAMYPASQIKSCIAIGDCRATATSRWASTGILVGHAHCNGDYYGASVASLAAEENFPMFLDCIVSGTATSTGVSSSSEADTISGITNEYTPVVNCYYTNDSVVTLQNKVVTKVQGTAMDYSSLNDVEFLKNTAKLDTDNTWFVNTTLTPSLFANKYAITLDANGGSGLTTTTYGFYAYEIFTPETASNMPVKSGEYFVGWALDAADTEAVTNVYVEEQDITLYALYTDKPQFHFETTTQNFTHGYGISELCAKDGFASYNNSGNGCLVLGADGISQAQNYPYVRVRAAFDETAANGGSLRYNSGENTNKLVDISAGLKADADGFRVYELNLAQAEASRDFWTGDITNIRYFVGDATMTDYIVFSDKQGIYKADFTLFENNGVPSTTAFVSEDSIGFNIDNVKWAKNTFTGSAITVRISLSPKAGYEFTSEADIMSLFTVNSVKPTNAVINEDGSALVVASVVPMSNIHMGSADSYAYDVSFDAPKKKVASLIVACYDASGILGDVKVVNHANVKDTLTLYTDKQYYAIKIFAFESTATLKPVAPSITINAG